MSKHENNDYPLRVTLSVIIASDDGSQLGTADGAQFYGSMPTHDDIMTLIKSLPAIMPEGFRLAKPEEMYEYIGTEKGLGRISVAAPKKWNKQIQIDAAMTEGESMVGAEDGDTP